MSGFSAEWLALREPFDRAARAQGLIGAVHAAVSAARRPDGSIRVIDLGAGTGANLRYVAPLLGGAQEWLLVDHDPALLTMASGLARWVAVDAECRVQTLALNLAAQLALVPLSEGCLLTASAVLDLVSATWLQDLVQRAADARAIVWFTLSYDGRTECEPAEPLDGDARELVNRHQRTDKGFGAALGPMAAAEAETLFRAHGFAVLVAQSDWQIGSEHAAMQHALLDGWYHAAREIAPERATALDAWRARRRDHIVAAGSTMRVGHRDLLAIPAGRRV